MVALGRLRLILFLMSLLTFSSFATLPGEDNIIPIVYILLGKKGRDDISYFTLNVELAATLNKVVVISSHPEEALGLKKSEYGENVTYLNANEYTNEEDITLLRRKYAHYQLDKSPGRQAYELICLERWFVLRNFMERTNTSRVMTADTDTAFFINITSYWAKSSCNAMIIARKYESRYAPQVSGHVSYWELGPLREFCNFTAHVYRNVDKFTPFFRESLQHRAGISDMTFLWWWYTKRFHQAGEWDYTNENLGFDFAQKANDFTLPVNTDFHVCNGFKPVNGSLFDFMNFWCVFKHMVMGYEQSKPYAMVHIAPNQNYFHDWAWDPKYKDEQVPQTKVYLNSIHYQGGAKHYNVLDVCKYLSHGFKYEYNKRKCESERPRWTHDKIMYNRRCDDHVANEDIKQRYRS